MNNLFVTLNLGILAAVSFVWSIKSLFILFAGITVCVIWLLFIRNFKLLNTAKFDVITSLEKQLPEAPFKAEWEILRKTKKYCDGTKLERVIPYTFICIYIIAAMIITIIESLH